MGRKKRQARRPRVKGVASRWGVCADWTFDEAGLLIAVDPALHRLAIQRPDRTVVFLGVKGSDPAEFNCPTGVETQRNVVYVVDSWNHRVQLFKLPEWKFSGVITGGGGIPFFCPTSVAIVDAFDGDSWVVLADGNNSRLTFHDLAGDYLFTHGLARHRWQVRVRNRENRLELRYDGGPWEQVR